MSENTETEKSRFGSPIYEAEKEPQSEQYSAPRKGTHKILNRVAAAAIGIGTVLSPSIATIAFAEQNMEMAATPANIELSQKNHDIALDKTVISQEDRAKYLTNWIVNVVGQQFYEPYFSMNQVGDPDLDKLSKQIFGIIQTKDMENGYKAYYFNGPAGTREKTIVDLNNNVVYKNVVIGPILKTRFEVIDISPLLRSRPTGEPTPAPEYGPNMVRFSFPDRGLAVIGTKDDDSWQFCQVFAVEGFVATSNPAEYGSSPWLNAGTPTGADNPQ